jgi:hypothetical protein
VLSWLLAFDMFIVGLCPSDALAALAPAFSPESGSARSVELEKIQTVLEGKVVRQRLADFGLTPEEINARLNDLPDGRLHELATNIDGLLPGGNVGVGFLLALVIVLLVIVVIYLAGHRISITKEHA